MSADTTTTEPCSTGVTNELGGCEPVGVTPTDLEQCVGICGPAVVDPSFDPFAQRSITTTTIAMATELPATATDVTVPLGVIAAAALLVGIIMARIAS